MIILTAASEIGKDEKGRKYKTFSFRGVIQSTMKKAEQLGYKTVVYDLGSLGIGRPYDVHDESFKAKGYYEKEIHQGYKSKSLFKPEIVRLCMKEHNDLVAYLDGDALLCENIDAVESDDYDIGVTLRDAEEIESDWHKEHFEIIKYVNAGVIFFRPTPAANRFVEVWQKTTEEVGNDQMALNKLSCPDSYPQPYSVVEIDGVRIKFFPGREYNFYYFDEGLSPNIRIMHFKGPLRNFYPFDWKKRLYCMTVIPVVKRLRSLVKKVLLT